MKNSNSEPSFGKKVFIVAGIILSIVFTMLKLQGHIDWSWWLVFSPLLVIVALYVIKLIIGLLFVLGVFKWSNDMKKQLKTICNDIVSIIQETNESNVKEQAQLLYDKIKWIDDHKKSIKTAIPDSSLKQFSFMLKNKQHKEICYGIWSCTEALSASQRKSAVESLKSFKEDYSKLWF